MSALLDQNHTRRHKTIKHGRYLHGAIERQRLHYQLELRKWCGPDAARLKESEDAYHGLRRGMQRVQILVLQTHYNVATDDALRYLARGTLHVSHSALAG